MRSCFKIVSQHDSFCSCHFLGECFLSLLFDMDFFFEHAAPLMVCLQILLQSLVIAVILEAVIRRPEHKMDWSADLTSKYIAYADYLLQHCTSPSKTDRWVTKCLALGRTDWLPAASDKGGVATVVQSCNPAIHQFELPSFAFFWQYQLQPSQHQQQHHQNGEQNKQQISQITNNYESQHQNQYQQRHHSQEHPLQQVKKRLKALPPLRTNTAS